MRMPRFIVHRVDVMEDGVTVTLTDVTDNVNVSEDCISRRIENIREILEKQSVTEQSSKVGEWQITDAYPHNVYCSECHKKFAQTHWAVWEDGSLPRNYCPNCGAKMRLE